MPLRFAGQYADEEVGLFYNYYRFYDPNMGRYIENDPIGLNSNYNHPMIKISINMKVIQIEYNPNLNHLYNYVNQNPLSLKDSYGLASEGNHRLQPEEVEKIKKQLADPKLDKKTRNKLKQKLKRHEKATGQRHSRQSKDKIKRCLTWISPAIAEAFYPSPERACDIYQDKHPMCEYLR